jgi:hypothetical protein
MLVAVGTGELGASGTKAGSGADANDPVPGVGSAKGRKAGSGVRSTVTTAGHPLAGTVLNGEALAGAPAVTTADPTASATTRATIAGVTRAARYEQAVPMAPGTWARAARDVAIANQAVSSAPSTATMTSRMSPGLATPGEPAADQLLTPTRKKTMNPRQQQAALARATATARRARGGVRVMGSPDLTFDVV